MNRLLAFLVSCALMIGAVTVADAATRVNVKNGGPGKDVMPGTRGVDVFDGRGGNDTLIGGAGADRLTGGPGVDTILGGDGSDTIDVRDGEVDSVQCGRGKDTVIMDYRVLVRGKRITDRVSRDCEIRKSRR